MLSAEEFVLAVVVLVFAGHNYYYKDVDDHPHPFTCGNHEKYHALMDQQACTRKYHYQFHYQYQYQMIATAESMYRIGNIHTSQGYFSLAIHCYHESLRLYQTVRRQFYYISRSQHQQQQQENGTINDTNSSLSSLSLSSSSSLVISSSILTCILADEGIVLANLGYVYFLQRDSHRAYQLTKQALSLYHWINTHMFQAPVVIDNTKDNITTTTTTTTTTLIDGCCCSKMMYFISEMHR